MCRQLLVRLTRRPQSRAFDESICGERATCPCQRPRWPRGSARRGISRGVGSFSSGHETCRGLSRPLVSGLLPRAAPELLPGPCRRRQSGAACSARPSGEVFGRDAFFVCVFVPVFQVAAPGRGVGCRVITRVRRLSVAFFPLGPPVAVPALQAVQPRRSQSHCVRRRPRAGRPWRRADEARLAPWQLRPLSASDPARAVTGRRAQSVHRIRGANPWPGTTSASSF